EYYPECKSTGIDTMESEHSAIARIEYFALNGMKLAQPNKGINVRKIHLANGKVLTDKVIK
ncbi:MAG: pectate lyase, partial [Bacteroidales bacterium]|nr:pectate lyase [Bacteroidales bacterium]